MTHLAAVNPKRHVGRSWRRYTTYAFAAKDCIAPLTAAEIASAAKTLPLAFVRQGDDFLLVAVLSLTPGTNLFVGADGRWLGGYIPSVFRGYPFRLARGGKKNELLFCVDEDSGLVSKDRSGGEVFYDDDGSLSGPVTEVLNFLTRVEKSRAATSVAVAALADEKLLVDWPLKIKVGERDQPVTGLYRVDEAGLNRLEDARFLAIRKAGALPVAYGQLLSMGNILILEKMAKMPAHKTDKAPDISTMLGDDDMLSF